MYMNEQKVTTLQEAAVLAEEFALTHKTVFVGKRETSAHVNTLKMLTHRRISLKGFFPAQTGNAFIVI